MSDFAIDSLLDRAFDKRATSATPRQDITFHNYRPLYPSDQENHSCLCRHERYPDALDLDRLSGNIPQVYVNDRSLASYYCSQETQATPLSCLC
jgi:hypothetical protein